MSRKDTHPMADHEPSRVIYMGGIPYDQTEDQILDIARSVGPVVTSKLLFDKETGKSKGYAFIQYQDVETASSAVRNLNNYSIGNRYLKCNFSNEQTFMNMVRDQNSSKRLHLEKEIPPLPPGIVVMNPNINHLNELVTSSLNSLDRNRMRNLVQDAKIMSRDYPELMEILLEKNPQLTFALVQATMLLDMSKPDDIKEILVEQPILQETLEKKEREQKQQSQQEPLTEGKPSEEQENNVADSSITANLQSLDKQQLDAIKVICGMSEQDILSQVPQQEQQLYFDIKSKYGIYLS